MPTYASSSVSIWYRTIRTLLGGIVIDHPSNDKDRLQDTEWIIFGGNPAPEHGVPQDHAFFDPLAKLVGRKVEDVRGDFDRTSGQLHQLIDGMQDRVKDFVLDEVSIQLGFSATGRLVFVAEAGIQTTVKMTYKRS